MKAVVNNRYAIEHGTMEVLRGLLKNLKDNPLWKAEYDKNTIVLNSVQPAPDDICDTFTEFRVNKTVEDLLIQIREGSYEKFVELPVPQAVDVACTAKDPATGFSVRFVRCFDPEKLTINAGFSVGVAA